jgi:DNA repair exonuclease SbcCD ATPase subunit
MLNFHLQLFSIKVMATKLGLDLSNFITEVQTQYADLQKLRKDFEDAKKLRVALEADEDEYDDLHDAMSHSFALFIEGQIDSELKKREDALLEIVNDLSGVLASQLT